MSTRELVEGSGIYLVPVEKLPKGSLFLRDPEQRTTMGLGPLLHICEKDIDTQIREPTWVVITGVVRWDSYYGRYACRECKEAWDKNDEAGLCAIWSDGYGTGDEGQA